MENIFKSISFLLLLVVISCKENNSTIEENKNTVDKIENPKAKENEYISEYLLDNVLHRNLVYEEKDNFGDPKFVILSRGAECKFSSKTKIFTVLDEYGVSKKYEFRLNGSDLALKNMDGEINHYDIAKTDYGIAFKAAKVEYFKTNPDNPFTSKIVGFVIQNKDDANRIQVPNEP